MAPVSRMMAMVVAACVLFLGCAVPIAALNCDAPSDDPAHPNTFVVSDLSSMNKNGYQLFGRAACSSIVGNVRIECSSASITSVSDRITNLNFLAGLNSISGYLLIENCDALLSISGLDDLKSIGGSSSIGLRIVNNSALEDLKAIENLESISQGGVEILRNTVLCYADLMKFNRLTSGTTARSSKLIDILLVNVSCSTKSCEEDCYCEYCGGPGSCTEQKDCEGHWYSAPGWVTNSDGNTAGYVFVIIFGLLFTLLFVVLVVGCTCGKVKVLLYLFSKEKAKAPPLRRLVYKSKSNSKVHPERMSLPSLKHVAEASIQSSHEEAPADEIDSDTTDKAKESIGAGTAEKQELSEKDNNDSSGFDLSEDSPIIDTEVPPQSEDVNERDQEKTTELDKDTVGVDTSATQDESAVEEQEEPQIEPPSRPLKPFSSFLNQQKEEIESLLRSRLPNEPNLTEQRVAAEMWQQNASIQTKYKSEYATASAEYENYIGKEEFTSGGNSESEWDSMSPEEKKGFISVGLTKDKARRRARRRSSQVLDLQSTTQSSTSELLFPDSPPRPLNNASDRLLSQSQETDEEVEDERKSHLEMTPAITSSESDRAQLEDRAEPQELGDQQPNNTELGQNETQFIPKGGNVVKPDGVEIESATTTPKPSEDLNDSKVEPNQTEAQSTLRAESESQE